MFLKTDHKISIIDKIIFHFFINKKIKSIFIDKKIIYFKNDRLGYKSRFRFAYANTNS